MTAGAALLPAVRWPTIDHATARRIAWAALAAVVVLQTQLALTKGINWDEFYHLSQIDDHRRGLFVTPTQLPHVWLFGWVRDLPGSGIDHVLLLRLFALPFELVTLAVVFDLARRFASRDAALLCVLAFVSGGYVFTQSLALRADPIAASLLMSALWIAMVRPARTAEASMVALLLAMAGIATIKSVFFAPAFAAAFLLRWRCGSSRRALVRCAALVAIIAPLAFYAIAALLQGGPAAAGGTDAAVGAAVQTTAQSSAAKMFSAGLFPRGFYLAKQAALAPLLAAVLVFAPVALVRARLDRTVRLALCALLLPLVSLAIYRNAYPYFFVFIVPPAMIAAAPAMECALRRYGLLPLTGLMLAAAAVLSLVEDRDVLARQRLVEAGIAQVFPDPVTHFSEDSFAAGFPRPTRYLVSGWGLENYRARGAPELSRAMDRETVPLVIANGRALHAAFSGGPSLERLLPADAARLRDNYVQHWGLVLVAGKTIPSGKDRLTIDVAVPGTYTIEDTALTIDGADLEPGDTIELRRGLHRVGGDRTRQATLRWGDRLPVPAAPFPTEPLYSDY